MTENVESLILEHLRQIRADIAVIKTEVREIKRRLGSLELAVAGLKRDHAASYEDQAEQHVRYDILVERVERIERRLDLREESP